MDSLKISSARLKRCAQQIGYCSLYSAVTMIMPFAPAAAQQPGVSPYGVIEVGSKGVKAFVFDWDYARITKCQTDPETWLKCINPETLPTIDVNPIVKANINATADAVVEQKNLLIKQYKVRKDKIYIVGSSGIFEIPHRLALAQKINITAQLIDKEGKSRAIEFISAEREATFAFEGLIATIPLKYQEQRREQALVLDIGSGNTKGSYRDRGRGLRPDITFSINWGTKKLTDIIDDQRGDRDFVAYAETIRRDLIARDVRKQFDNQTAAMARPRIYMIGGIVWAVSNLANPRDRRKFPPLTVADIDRVYARAVAPNAFSRLCGKENPDMQFNSDIAKVCNAFSIKNIIAGLQIMKAYSQELSFEDKNVFFFRESQFAWPLGYLNKRLGNY